MTRVYPVVLVVALVVAGWGAAGCGSPSRPSPVTDAPKITCPASQTAQVVAAPTLVAYPSPNATGGTAPVKISCSPTSGSSFPVGSTAVSCTAIDADIRTGSCSFTVTVTIGAPPPRITWTKYLAFGDSVTEGKPGPARYDGEDQFPDAYAAVLYKLMTLRYTAQTIDVTDRGVGGERVQGGVARLPGELNAAAPQVLLLQEGVNDLILGGSIASVIDGLRTMIHEAKSRGIVVFLGTLLPMRLGGSRAGFVAPLLIDPANKEIRGLASSEGVILVDLYQAFGGSPDPWIDADGLHPTVEGYKVMGQTFFLAISSRYEMQSLTMPVAQALRPARARPLER